MLTFDAPTREFCTPRRLATNTPLQALVLWNDPQFVEAARKSAERVLLEPADANADDARLALLYRRATGEEPTRAVREAMVATLARHRARYQGAPDDARQLIAVGASPADPSLDPAELAAWTLVANAVLSSDATIVKD